MGIMVYSLEWVMQDFVHQPFEGLHKGSHKASMILVFRVEGPT